MLIQVFPEAFKDLRGVLGCITDHGRARNCSINNRTRRLHGGGICSGCQRPGLFLRRHRAPSLLTLFPEPFLATVYFHSPLEYETWKTRGQGNATCVRLTTGKLVSGDERLFAYQQVPFIPAPGEAARYRTQ